MFHGVYNNLLTSYTLWNIEYFLALVCLYFLFFFVL